MINQYKVFEEKIEKPVLYSEENGKRLFAYHHYISKMEPI